MDRYESFGRMNQKRRTRAALKAAAAELIRAGKVPTITQVAEIAMISRTTAYRYFPNQDSLTAEVLLDEATRTELEAVFEAAQSSGSAEERLDAVIRADHALVVRHEAAFRTAVRAMLLPDSENASLPRRPGNRLRYLANALDPVADHLGPERFERLVMGIAMCVGIESIIVTEDICGLSHVTGETIKRWAAAAMLKAALDEVKNDLA